MSPDSEPEQTDQVREFQQAGLEKQPSIVQEFWYFITEYKKWWMLPILAVLAVMGILVALSSTGAAPFIYTLF